MVTTLLMAGQGRILARDRDRVKAAPRGGKQGKIAATPGRRRNPRDRTTIPLDLQPRMLDKPVMGSGTPSIPPLPREEPGRTPPDSSALEIARRLLVEITRINSELFELGLRCDAADGYAIRLVMALEDSAKEGAVVLLERAGPSPAIAAPPGDGGGCPGPCAPTPPTDAKRAATTARCTAEDGGC